MEHPLILMTKIVAGACSSGSVDVSSVCSGTGLPVVKAGTPELNQILTVTFATLAAVAVLFVVIGGFRLVISNGDPEGTSKAKSTILYAVIGLVVSLSAEALVSFALRYIK